MDILDGVCVKKDKLNKLKEDISSRKLMGINSPTLAVIQIGNLMESNKFIKNKVKACSEVGININCYNYDIDVSCDILKEKIISLNNNSNINGIIIQLPLPDRLKIYEKELINLISPLKDVDGLTDYNYNKLLNNEDCLFSSTVVGIMDIFNYYNISLIDKTITIVGNGKLVGKPLSILLKNMGCNVCTCNSKTKDISLYTKKSSIIISCVGKPNLICNDVINSSSIIIDAGTTYIDGHLVGDVCSDVICSFITKVPGGVGQTTVSGLLSNTLKAQDLQNSL